MTRRLSGLLLLSLAALLHMKRVASATMDCLITEDGAIADNQTINTVAIQSTIDKCHAMSPMGSRVIVPRGAFKTGSVLLRSNMELHLEKGAGLFGSINPHDYPIVRGLPFGTMWRALVGGYNLTNVKITGENSAVPESDSVIDGVAWWWHCLIDRGRRSYPNPDAAPWCRFFNPTNRSISSLVGGSGSRPPLRPKLIEFFNCTGVTIANFTAQNSACWTVHPTFSRDVTVRGMTVLGPREIGGIDGIDPDSCVNCLIENNHIDVGDDGISIKSYNYSYVPEPTPCQNVTIRRTTVLSRNICLGASTSGGVSNVTFEDMILGETGRPSLPWAIKFKISSGFIRDVTLRRIRIGPVGDTPWMFPNGEGKAFMIDFFDKNKTNPETWVHNITFEDITVESSISLGHFSGPGSVIEGLTVRNVTAKGPGVWGGCTGVDLADTVVRDVSPPLVCRGPSKGDDVTVSPLPLT